MPPETLPARDEGGEVPPDTLCAGSIGGDTAGAVRGVACACRPLSMLCAHRRACAACRSCASLAGNNLDVRPPEVTVAKASCVAATSRTCVREYVLVHVRARRSPAEATSIAPFVGVDVCTAGEA